MVRWCIKCGKKLKITETYKGICASCVIKNVTAVSESRTRVDQLVKDLRYKSNKR